MSRNISERDWKVFKEVRQVALERLCGKILEEARARMEAPGKSSHERFLNLFKLINNRNDDIARGFDDFRRSTAVMQIAIIHKMGLLNREELQRFSPEVLEVATIYAPIPEA